jgi:hypothetical protein
MIKGEAEGSTDELKLFGSGKGRWVKWDEAMKMSRQDDKATWLMIPVNRAKLVCVMQPLPWKFHDPCFFCCKQ